MASSNTPTEETEWVDCPEGTLSAFSSQHRSQLALGTALKTAVASVVVLLAVGAYSVLSPGRDQENATAKHYNCIEALRLVDSYFAEELSAEEQQGVVRHLDHCPRCKRKYREKAQALGEDFACGDCRNACPQTKCNSPVPLAAAFVFP